MYEADCRIPFLEYSWPLTDAKSEQNTKHATTLCSISRRLTGSLTGQPDSRVRAFCLQEVVCLQAAGSESKESNTATSNIFMISTSLRISAAAAAAAAATTVLSHGDQCWEITVVCECDQAG